MCECEWACRSAVCCASDSWVYAAFVFASVAWWACVLVYSCIVYLPRPTTSFQYQMAQSKIQAEWRNGQRKERAVCTPQTQAKRCGMYDGDRYRACRFMHSFDNSLCCRTTKWVWVLEWNENRADRTRTKRKHTHKSALNEWMEEKNEFGICFQLHFIDRKQLRDRLATIFLADVVRRTIRCDARFGYVQWAEIGNGMRCDRDWRCLVI